MTRGDNEIVIHNLKDILKDSESWPLIKQSMKEMIPSPKRLLILVAIFLATDVSLYFGNKTMLERTTLILSNTNTICLTLLAMVFTGYALFSALMNRNTMETLLKHKIGSISLYKKYNMAFLGLSIYYLSIIIVNFIFLIFLNNLPPDWHLAFLSSKTNLMLSTGILSIYLVIILNAIVEIKCFLYNLYQCFSLHAYSNIIRKD